MAYGPYKAAYDATMERLGDKRCSAEGDISWVSADSLRLATKQIEQQDRHLLEPARPQSLADQLRDLKAMMYEIALQRQTGRMPSFLSQHITASASMPLEEEQAVSHAALQHVQQQGNAGKHAASSALWSQ